MTHAWSGEKGSTADQNPECKRSPWTREAVETLKRGAREGLSFTDVAEILNVTRCAVAGKAHRLGISFNCESRGEWRSGENGLQAIPQGSEKLRIIRLVSQRPLTDIELSEALGQPEECLSGHLAELASEGRLQRISAGPRSYWVRP